VSSTELAKWIRGDVGRLDELHATPEDWRKRADALTRSGLAGIALECAGEQAAAWPAKFTAHLKRGATAVAAENLNFRHELVRLLRAFDQAGVPVMLLKGAALNLSLYDRPDLRPMTDLDLLIHPADASAARKALHECGCRPQFDLLREDFFPKYYYELAFVTGSLRPVRIDLHVRPLRPLRIARFMPDDALWDGAQRVELDGTHASLFSVGAMPSPATGGGGHAVGRENMLTRDCCRGKACHPVRADTPNTCTHAWVPRPELMLIHLAAHAAFHGCARLLWLYDIHRLLQRHGGALDWGLVVERCRRWRLAAAVTEALRQTAVRWGTALPPAASAWVAHREGNWPDRLLLAHAARDGGSPVVRLVVDLLCTPGLGFRLGYLVALLRPARGHLADVYPYRHWGWTATAHVWRWLRAAGRTAFLPIQLTRRAGGRLLSRSGERLLSRSN